VFVSSGAINCKKGAFFLDCFEEETLTLLQNFEHQSPGDAAPHPKRMETLRSNMCEETLS